MYLLTNTVMDYAWGSVDALPDLLGLPRTGNPQAELWVGAHPGAPSTVAIDGRQRPLGDVVAADPSSQLGAATVERLGDELPFLLKILCAGEPLSLQVHPSKQQAAHGYAAESAAGVPVDAGERNYKDANHKPELLYALSPFEALCGFAPPPESRALLAAIREHTGPDAVLDGVISDLGADDEAMALRAATERLLATGADDTGPLVAAVAAACAKVPGPSAATAVTLAEAFPRDAGVVLSLLLNRVSLTPGRAMFLPAGNLHAYLRGTGIEVMAASDNVLRGGLTSKHVDVPELLSIVNFLPTRSADIAPEVVSHGVVAFCPPVADFRLEVIDLAAGHELCWHEPLARTAIVLGGEFRLSGAHGDLALKRGNSVFVAAADSPVVVRGSGRLAAAAPNI